MWYDYGQDIRIIRPGYHMNKQHWITILLDGSVSEAKTLDFLDMSYDLIDGADRKEEK